MDLNHRLQKLRNHGNLPIKVLVGQLGLEPRTSTLYSQEYILLIILLR